MDETYDLVIIGGGPAGMTAGLYACRARMKTLLLERGACGGQALIAYRVENFPGFPEGVSGPDISDWMLKQAEHFGLQVKSAEAKSITFKEDKGLRFQIGLTDAGELRANSLIIATGAKWNYLNIPGERELTGRGVSWCATCDGPLFKEKDVIVVGGGDTALEDALFLTKFARKVTIVHRRNTFRAVRILHEKVAANKKIEVIFQSVVTEIIGKKSVEAARIKDVNTDKERELKADGVFILVGMNPNSEIVKGVVKTDEKGYIIADDEMRTSVDGIFACGDVRKKLFRQIVTAAGDGATAAFSAEHYVDRIKGREYPA